MFLRATVLIPLLALLAGAQTKWDSLKMLAPGTVIRLVSDTSPKAVEGKLRSVSDQELVLGTRTFARAKIVSVAVRESGRRGRHVLIGLVVGTAAGVLIGYAVGHSQESHCQKAGQGWCGTYVAVDDSLGGAGGALAGSLAGSFWRGGKWDVLYTR